MAVSKLWPVTVRLATVLDYASNPEKTTKSKSKYSDADYQALRDVVAYAKDGEKTERELFCEGIHCNPQTAREQFITVKEQFDKLDGIQAYHGYLSFEETDITPELAQQVGMAFAERMWGDRFQVLVTTHLNTEHLHCHFVVNSVSFRDGKRLQNKEKAWWYFRHIADEVCLEHGLSVVQNPEAYQSPRILTQKDKAGMPTRYCLPFLQALEHFPKLVEVFVEKVKELFSIKEAQERKEREDRAAARKEQSKHRRGRNDWER